MSNVEPSKTNSQMDNAIKAIIPMIQESKFVVISCITKDNLMEPYVYTVGLQKYNHPEIVISGFNPEAMLSLAKEVGTKVVNGSEKFLDGSTYELYDASLCGFREPNGFIKVEERMDVAAAFYGEAGLKVVQMFLPDEIGLLPWDRDCDPDVVSRQYHLFDISNPPSVKLH